jgi:Xaa-Pro aminopeptidase/Xaa-Pro dipeptidase
MTRPPVEALERRREALARRLAEIPVDALLVSHRPNIAYLSHFFGSAGYLFVTSDRLTVVSDSRYAGVLDDLAKTLPALSADIVSPGAVSAEERLASLLVESGATRIGFEPSALTVAEYEGLGRRCAQARSEIEWIPVNQAVEDLRAVKDETELAVFREAGRRLSDVSKCIISNALAGISERQLAAVVEWELRQKGFEKPAFDTIVASGPNAAVPHHRAGDRVLVGGDLVVVDFGGVLRGYSVDMTRTITIGAPSERQQLCWDMVAAAQRAAFGAARMGVAADEVDATARSLFDAAGMGEAFAHGLGHGLGLEIHERPRLARRRPGVAGETIAAGMVFTLEPGAYFPGWGGIRIEDDVVVTETGPEWLTEPVT